MTVSVNFVPSLNIATQGLGEEIADKAIKTIISTSGAMAYRLTEEHIQNALTTDISQEVKDRLVAQGPGVFVDIYTEFTTKLSELEMKALVTHEKAHIELGHVDRVVQLQKENGTSGPHLDLQMELEADAEGAKATSKKAMRLAIIKMIIGSGRVVRKYGLDKSLFQWKSRLLVPLMVLGDPIIQRRLKALR